MKARERSSHFEGESIFAHPVVTKFSRLFRELGIDDAENNFLQSLEPGSRDIFLYTQSTHLHKAHPVFIALIGDYLELELSSTKTIAAAADILWPLSVMYDDVLDQDAVRGGKPTAWVKFGKREIMNHCQTILESLLSELGNVCGAEVVAAAQACIQKGLDSFQDQERMTLQSATIEQVLHIYDARNAYYSSFGVHAVFKMANGASHEEERAAKGLELLIQAAQIINDWEDLHDARDVRGHSDIRNGMVTLPLLLLFHNLSVGEKENFLSFWGKKKALTLNQGQYLAELLTNHQIAGRVSDRVRGTYKDARRLLIPVIPPKHYDLLDKWIDYKQQTTPNNRI